jgi:hypothetical protein
MLNKYNLTPLGMCRPEILKKLGLLDRVVVSVENANQSKFDNNYIIKGMKNMESLT